jgi:Domain of unknown function (DUF4105)
MKKISLLILLLALAFYVFFIVPKKPSNNRNWSPDQKVLSNITKTGNVVRIENVRNFTYASTTSYTENYYTKDYDLSKIKKVWYIVEPFSGYKGAAHTFLSFEFEDNVFLSVSVEIRKEVGESFSAKNGLLREYELMYVFADEKDAVKLRTNFRKDTVYMYPVQTTPEKARLVFEDITVRAQALAEKPEFYNTFTNNCTTNIIAHVNAIDPKRIPLTYAAIFPEYSDIVAHKLGLIPNNLPIEDIRAKYKINEKAETYADSPDFSTKIREGLIDK